MVFRRTVVVLAAWSACALFSTAPAEAQEPLQRGFSSVTLGMELDAAKLALAGDPNFRYRGDPDVSLVPGRRLPVIDAAGVVYVERGLFQFRGDRLYLITILLDRGRLDYFSVYRTLVDRYGEPIRLDPGSAVWENETTRVTLERPLTVKYVDLPVFFAIIDEGRMEEALDQISRDRFLDQL